MIKKIALLFCFVFTAQAELLHDSQGIKVNAVDMDLLLETGSIKAQKQILKDKAKLKVQLEQLYVKKKMARMAEAEGLGTTGIDAVRLQSIIDNALYLLKLDAVKLSDKKDYSKFAYQIYQVNEEKYQVEERVNAAHVLVSTKKITDEEALEKAQIIRQELLLGANFSDVALRESDDKSVKKNKGELGVFIRSQMVKPFSDAVFTMEVGTISEPVKTRYGYHIIKLNNKLPAGTKPFSEVKEEIIDNLKEKDWQMRRTDFYQQLKAKNRMEIDDTALDAYINKKLDAL